MILKDKTFLKNISEVNNEAAVVFPSDCVVDRLLTMKKLEQTTYRYVGDETGTPLKTEWRETISQWMYSVVDAVDQSREVVDISLSLLDRYLAKLGNVATYECVQLAAMTSLHLVIKVHEKKKIKISDFASLSRGHFEARHIEAMESHMLSALGWLIHPPTQISFVSYLLELVPDSDIHPSTKQDIFDMAQFQTELAVCDSFFVGYEPSTIAFACCINAIGEVSNTHFSEEARASFLQKVQESIGLSSNNGPVRKAYTRLQEVFAANFSAADNKLQETFNCDEGRPLHGRTSPDCVRAVEREPGLM